MKKIIGTLIVITIMWIGYWCYDNLIYFEYDMIPVYRCEMDRAFDGDKPYTYYMDFEKLCSRHADFKEKAEQKLKIDLETLNTSLYGFLYVYGGEIQSFKMVRNAKNWFPDIKYKKNVPKNIVSVYIMKLDRYIELTDV